MNISILYVVSKGVLLYAVRTHIMYNILVYVCICAVVVRDVSIIIRYASYATQSCMLMGCGVHCWECPVTCVSVQSVFSKWVTFIELF